MYRGFTLDEIDNQFLMHPFGGFALRVYCQLINLVTFNDMVTFIIWVFGHVATVAAFLLTLLKSGALLSTSKFTATTFLLRCSIAAFAYHGGRGRFVRPVCYMHQEPGIVIGSVLFNSHNPHTLMKTTKIGERAVCVVRQYRRIADFAISRI